MNASYKSITHFPLVSIIVTTKNEERNIANCLKSILNSQSLIEIIVVDNNSTDKTVEIVKSYCHIQLYNFGPNRAAQLNFGANIAKGKYILFPDADMILSGNVIKKRFRKL